MLTACAVAAAAGAAAAVVLMRPAPALTDPLCAASTSASPARLVSGTGRVVVADLAKQYLTLDHDEIKGVAMPAMNMMFAVKSRAAMEQLRPRDKIRFIIDRSDMGIVNIVVVERVP
jgi:Cu(I)/Ag(I) efflux system periplasmic protein CusF